MIELTTVEHAANLPVAQFVWLLLLAALAIIAARWLRIPSTVTLLLIGLMASAFGLLSDLKPTSTIILLVFLPPLLFQASQEIELSVLRATLPTIVALAVPGVLVSAVIIGVVVAWTTPLGIWPALLFGALISATDPVAVVSSFQRLGAPQDLTMVVEGESLLNDGTALVLSSLLVTAAQTSRLDVGGTIGLFLWSVVAGLVIGAVIAFTISQLLRLVDDPAAEMILSTVVAYGSFILADRLHASGVLAVVMAGLVFGGYGRHIGLSAESRHLVDDFWTVLGFVADAILFVLIGLAVHPIDLLQPLRWVIIAVLVVIAARAVVVYVISWSIPRMTPAYAHVLFWGGLRGGVAVAVALSLPADVPHRQLIIHLTFGVVLFTILVQGLTIQPLATRLRLLPSGPKIKRGTSASIETKP